MIKEEVKKEYYEDDSLDNIEELLTRPREELEREADELYRQMKANPHIIEKPKCSVRFPVFENNK